MAPHKEEIMPVHAIAPNERFAHTNGKLHNGVRASTQHRHIIDIRSSKTAASLKGEIASNFLDVQDGEMRTLPTMLLYDAEGLKLFEKITYVDEYYLTEAEIAVLEKWADNIAERIEDGGVIVELGSGYVS